MVKSNVNINMKKDIRGWLMFISHLKICLSKLHQLQRFLSQPFDVSEKFTGFPGKYVHLSETIRGFKEIIEGKHDSLPESAFLFVGTIDEAVEKAKKVN